MRNELAMVLVAVITAGGGVIVALIQSLRRENKTDHANVRQHLNTLSNIAERTERKVDSVKDELHQHLEWHQESNSGPNTSIGTRKTEG